MIPPQALNQLQELLKRQQFQPFGSLPSLPIGGISRNQVQSPQGIGSLPMQGIDIPARDNTPNFDNVLYNLNSNENKAKSSPIPGILTGLGSVGTTMANIGKPNVGLGALSGAATGAGYGAMCGPLGVGVGAAIGGLTGLVGTGLNRSSYEEQRLEAEKGRIKAATVFGSDIGEFEAGGNVGGNPDELTPIQTTKGERIVLPSGHIYKSKATQTHKQMASNYITDILPADAVVASVSKKISKDRADKMVLGFETIEYTEEGNSSIPKEIKLGDIFSKKKMSPAELMNVIKNKFPTNDIEMDPFARKANVANLKARLPWVNAVMAASK
jgi:hypothetical protein